MIPHKQHRHIRRQRRYLSIINIFLATITAIILFTTLPVVHAIPAFTAVAAADIPRGTNAAPTTPMPTQIPTTTTTATYTYTVTKISSTTLTTVSPVPVLHISPHILSLITTVTVTTYEPWPAFPSGPSSGNLAWPPTTVLEEVVSSVTWVERRRYLDMGDVRHVGHEGGTKRKIGEEEEEEEVRGRGGGKYEERGDGEKEEETTITSFVVTTENTWVVHPAAGPTTDIFLATGVGVVVGCGGCSLAPAQPTGLEPAGSGSRRRGSAARRHQNKMDEPGENKRLMEKPKSAAGLLSRTADTMTGMEAEAKQEQQDDLICKSTNLTTACQGQQCIWKPHAPLHSSSIHEGIIITNNTTTTNDTTSKDTPPATATEKGTGTYWCLHIHPYHYADSSLRMGRACWGPYLRYRQLNAPCLVGDVGMACLPCVKGGEGEPGKKDESWDAVFWEGEE